MSRHRSVVALCMGAGFLLAPGHSVAELTYVTMWGTYGSGPGQFNYPTGLARSPAGDIYVADGGNNRICRFTADGQFLASFGSLGSAPGQFREPNHLMFSPTNGELYVTDLNNQRIQRFTPDGVFVMTWGSQGGGPGQFLAPWGVHVDANGDVYVACRDQARIQKFTENGTFLAQWGDSVLFPKPHAIATDADGNIYVGDVHRHDMQKFDAAFGFLLQWGGPGSLPGQFLHPHHVTYTGGKLVVVDWLEHPHGGRLQSFTTSGVLTEVMVAGHQGTDPLQFHTIIQAATDGQGTWWVAEWGNHRVQVLREAATAVPSSLAARPSGRVLGEPFPNPSSGAVRLPVHLPAGASGPCELTIYDVRGERLTGYPLMAPRELQWDGMDRGGRAAAPGVYFVALHGPGFHDVRKLVRVR